MMLLVLIVVILIGDCTAQISSASGCVNLEGKYRVVNKYGKILRCIDCRICPPGSQPIKTCGTTIGIDESIGGCQPCPSGTISSKRDTKPCEKCRAGYVPNQARNQCVLYKLSNTTEKPKTQKPTFSLPSNVPETKTLVTKKTTLITPTTHKSGPNMLTTTRKEDNLTNDQRNKDNKWPISVIVGIIIAVLVVVILVVLVVCWYLRKLEKLKGNSGTATMELLDDSDTEVQSPEQEPVDHNHSSAGTKLGSYPSEIYNKICTVFDTGPAGKDFTALAGWLELTHDELTAFANKQNKTDCIIRSWMSRRENSVAKFKQILETKGMTSLVDEINACKV